jgi:cold shock CspA family protein
LATGEVEWFDAEKGFSFITPDDGGKEVFAHYSAISGRGYRSLKEDQKVSYDIEQGQRVRVAPNLCNDGHDSPCVDGREGGLVSADVWLKKHVPAIIGSPAFKQDGMLVITFDESEGNQTGPKDVPGGTAGGRIGALVLSPYIKGGILLGSPRA